MKKIEKKVEKKLDLDLDMALEELAKKLRPAAQLDDDSEYGTPYYSC